MKLPSPWSNPRTSIPKALARRLRVYRVSLRRLPNGRWSYSFAIPVSSVGFRTRRDAAERAMICRDRLVRLMTLS